MRYEFLYHVDVPNTLEINVDERLIATSLISTHASSYPSEIREEILRESLVGDWLADFHDMITALPGIQPALLIERYEITLSKARLFRWEALIPHIEILIESLDREAVFVKDLSAPLRTAVPRRCANVAGLRLVVNRP